MPSSSRNISPLKNKVSQAGDVAQERSFESLPLTYWALESFAILHHDVAMMWRLSQARTIVKRRNGEGTAYVPGTGSSGTSTRSGYVQCVPCWCVHSVQQLAYSASVLKPRVAEHVLAKTEVSRATRGRTEHHKCCRNKRHTQPPTKCAQILALRIIQLDLEMPATAY